MITASANQDQIDYWNSVVGERWASHQTMIDAMMEPFTIALVEKLGIRNNDHIIDIGCGCGDLSERIASLGAVVTGVDISEPMLALAKKQSAGAVNYYLADAETEHFTDSSFDSVASRFGVMFFNNPIAAFSNIRRALKPSGRLAFVCWQYAKDNQWVTLPGKALADLLPKPTPVDPTAPGPFAFADPKRISRFLGNAGFGAIRIEPMRAAMPIALERGVAGAVDYISTIGPTARAIADASPAHGLMIKERLRLAMANYENKGTVRLEGAVWLVSAEC